MARRDDSYVHARMLELERELVEFQESSKELEQALEEELRAQETQTATLSAQVQAKDARIAGLTQSLAALNTELNEQSARLAEEAAAYEKTIADLKHKLIHMEILNDDMASRDRVLESKLQLATQFNDELLEKIAMVENELELERRSNARHQLTITNLETEKKELGKVADECMQCSIQHKSHAQKVLRRESTLHDLSFGDGTILDIGEMLASEPPKAAPVEVPRSESLLLFQELYTKSGALRQKVGEVNMSLAYKSPSTTQITRSNTTSGALTPTVVPEGKSEKILKDRTNEGDTAKGRQRKKSPEPQAMTTKETKNSKNTLKGLIKGLIRD